MIYKSISIVVYISQSIQNSVEGWWESDDTRLKVTNIISVSPIFILSVFNSLFSIIFIKTTTICIHDSHLTNIMISLFVSKLLSVLYYASKS